MKFIVESTESGLPAPLSAYLPYSINMSSTIHASTGAPFDGAICGASGHRSQGLATLFPGRTYTLCAKCVEQHELTQKLRKPKT